MMQLFEFPDCSSLQQGKEGHGLLGYETYWTCWVGVLSEAEKHNVAGQHLCNRYAICHIESILVFPGCTILAVIFPRSEH